MQGLSGANELTAEAFLKEIKRLEDLASASDAEVSLSEKLKIISFLKIVHLRYSYPFIRFYSEILPLNIYLLNEFFTVQSHQQYAAGRDKGVSSKLQVSPHSTLIPTAFANIFGHVLEKYLAAKFVETPHSIIMLLQELVKILSHEHQTASLRCLK
jgi:hypothetical protein